jgi:hypothetical protein
MTKNERLDVVYENILQLYKSKNQPMFEGIGIKDGIIDENLFDNEKERILIICKDHNNRTKQKNTDINDFRLWWNQGVKYVFANRISSWAIHILNNFNSKPEDFTKEAKAGALKKLAFINIKKIAGIHTINFDTIYEFIKIGRDSLNEQIDIINPTIIICCLNNQYLTEELLNIKLEAKGEFLIGKRKEAKVINFFHPSSRKNNSYLLNALEKAINY